jgi:transposase
MHNMSRNRDEALRKLCDIVPLRRITQTLPNCGYFASFDNIVISTGLSKMIKRRNADDRQLSRKKLEDIRFSAVKAVKAGEAPSAVARRMGLYTNRLFVWLAAYRDGGWLALRAREASGRPKRRSAKQIHWISETVMSSGARQRRLRGALWTRAQVRALIAERFHVKLSEASVRRLLRQLGLADPSLLVPASDKDRSQLARWQKRDYPIIRAHARRENAKILFANVSAIRTNLNMISATSPLREQRFMVVRGPVAPGLLVDFLKRLLLGHRRPIYLITNRHPIYRSKKVKAYVESLRGKLALFLVPPPAPKRDPDKPATR